VLHSCCAAVLQVLERCTLCPLGSAAESSNDDDSSDAPVTPRADGKLFRQLLDMYSFYQGFEINDQTGRPLAGEEVILIVISSY
jgi:hypothetical protein